MYAIRSYYGYFKDEQVRENSAALTSLARREWQRLTSLAELRRFVQAAREQLARAGGPRPLTPDDEP